MLTTDTPIFRSTIVNLRDLHGITTKDNAQIKEKKLFRCANPSWASEEDQEFLKSLDLACLVDFRSLAEKKQDEEKEFKQSFPVTDEAIELGDLISNQILNRIKTLTQEDVYGYMRYLNEMFVTDYQPQFQSFMKLLETGQTTLFHCTAGKDRTGFAALLLLSALGVDEDVIMANYLESNLYTHDIFQKNDEHAKRLGVDLTVYKLFQEVREDYLFTAIKKIQTEFGGMEKYLTHTLDVNIEKIQNAYLV